MTDQEQRIRDQLAEAKTFQERQRLLKALWKLQHDERADQSSTSHAA